MSGNKILAICVVMLLILISLSACSTSKYKDGVYSAEMPDFPDSGWKDMVEVTIEGGEIVKINWDSVYRDDSIPIRKKQYSKSGLYGMLKAGAIDEWYDQAILAEQFVLANGIDAMTVTDDGYTDSITGCTIHVYTLDELFRECLNQAKK